MTNTAVKGFEVFRIQLQVRGMGVNTVFLKNISAPECLIIQNVHGKESVTLIERCGLDIEKRMTEQGKWVQRIRPASSMVEYLISKYGKNAFEAVFPGANPILPYTYNDAGITGSEIQDEFSESEGWTEIAPVKEVEEKPVVAEKAQKKYMVKPEAVSEMA